MENIVLSKSEKVISDCHKFTSKKDWVVYFSIDYIVNRKEWDSWVKKPEFKVFDRSVFPQTWEKKSDDEICQELKGKSLIIEQKIAW